jgi:hypothetical protein
MSPVRPADDGNPRRVPRSGKPVVDGGPNAPTLDRRLARPMMASNEQDDAVAGVNRLLEKAVDRAPRSVQRHPVEVEHPVGLGRARAKPPVPACIEGIPEPRAGWHSSRNWKQSRLAREQLYIEKLSFFFCCFRIDLLTR